MISDTSMFRFVLIVCGLWLILDLVVGRKLILQFVQLVTDSVVPQ
jgi:hypothetical protein